VKTKKRVWPATIAGRTRQRTLPGDRILPSAGKCLGECEFHIGIYSSAYTMTVQSLPTVYEDITTQLSEEY
jgi:hypothetical protein